MAVALTNFINIGTETLSLIFYMQIWLSLWVFNTDIAKFTSLIKLFVLYAEQTDLFDWEKKTLQILGPRIKLKHNYCIKILY